MALQLPPSGLLLPRGPLLRTPGFWVTLPQTKVDRRENELCPELRVVSMETPTLC